MKEVQEVVFCTRLKYDDPHWYANIGYYCDDETKKAYTGNGQPDAGRLYKWNVHTGEKTVLLDAQGGSIRDPQVHYDGRKILFSYRKAGTEFYHLHEIQSDGTGLKQLTSGEFDDYEPAYLPDGGIAFVSTRCKRWVNCWMTQVGVIYRCDADGGNIELISANTEHDNTPWVLPDGRILYTRWEYVDRSQVEFHHLWTMNPDGTGAAVYYGNQQPHIVMIDAKPVPGTDKVVASFSPGHGVNEHAGIATIVSSEKGPDDATTPRRLHQGKLVRDPFSLSEHCFLAARDNEIVLLDGSGRVEPIYRHTGDGLVHEPRPIMPRPRERIITRRTNPVDPMGRMVLADVYDGRNLTGVKRGEIKTLLILESLPKQVNFSGGPDLVSWLGTFTLERVVGTVPVEADGSAYFEVPAGRQLFFVALDKDDLSVKRMQSFTDVMPGEVIGCVGCHEHRAKTPENRRDSQLQALRRAPSKIQPFAGFPDVMDFTRDIQPILDRHCVRCHAYEKREGRVLLEGDLGPTWSHSFFSLFAHRQVADGRNGLGNQPPRTLGSSASALLKKVDGSHYEVKATPDEWRALWLWIESGAPYAGTYAALRNERTQANSGAAIRRVFQEQSSVFRRRCHSCHNPQGSPAQPPSFPFNYETRRKTKGGLQRPTAVYERIILENDPIAFFSTEILLNFTRPRLSPLLLGPLAKSAGGFGSCGEVFRDAGDPDYQALLSAIEKGKIDLDTEPRFATPGFRPNAQYIREMKKFAILPQAFDPAKQSIDVFETDQKYWRSLW
ncbi:MAG: PD40 domain-containing protein [Verrucomicrobia bacterium]|nr:PD40 domain-containing protein [Verrucomicrobiota bacterium]